MKQVEVVLASNDRVTRRAGDVFLKIDADQSRASVEVEAMAIVPIPTPEILWCEPPVLALRPGSPVFIHGDLQVDHVFVDGGDVVGVIDWSEASRGDALFDLATLTLGHPEHLEDVIAGYGRDVDHDLIRAWWSLRCLSNVRWLVENGDGAPEEYPEVAVLRSQP